MHHYTEILFLIISIPVNEPLVVLFNLIIYNVNPSIDKNLLRC